MRKNIFASLLSVHKTISLSRHEQVCLSGLRFGRYFSHHREADDGRSIFRNVAHLKILVHGVINLLYNTQICVRTLICVFDICRLTQVRDTKVGTYISNETFVNAKKAPSLQFYHFWAVDEKPTGGIEIKPTYKHVHNIFRLFHG